ncbi:MAG: diguanylate cyclase, partial [Bacteroidales bacterium]
QLYNRGVGGVVLFNRFYAPDIDISKMKITSAEVFSSPSDIRQTLRWVGIVSGNIEKMDIAASTGIHDSNGAIKMLLAGASAIQVCSALYLKGIGYLQNFISGLKKWMNENNYKRIEDFRGRMSYKNIPDPSVYERSQFMRYFSNYY